MATLKQISIASYICASKCHSGTHRLSGTDPDISGKGVFIYKGIGVHFADFISFFLNIP